MTNVVGTRITQEEIRDIQREAQEKGCSASDILRDYFRAGRQRGPLDDEIKRLQEEILKLRSEVRVQEAALCLLMEEVAFSTAYFKAFAEEKGRTEAYEEYARNRRVYMAEFMQRAKP